MSGETQVENSGTDSKVQTTASKRKTKEVKEESKETKTKDSKKVSLKKLDPETAKLLTSLREKVNKKEHGRKIRDGEIIHLGLTLIEAHHMEAFLEKLRKGDSGKLVLKSIKTNQKLSMSILSKDGMLLRNLHFLDMTFGYETLKTLGGSILGRSCRALQERRLRRLPRPWQGAQGSGSNPISISFGLGEFLIYFS